MERVSGSDPDVQRPSDADLPVGYRHLSRREFLRLCEISALGLALSGCATAEIATTSSTATTTAAALPTTTALPTSTSLAVRSAAPAPSPVPLRSTDRWPNYDAAGQTSNTTGRYSSAPSEAKVNGTLKASASAKIGTNSQGASAEGRAWVRWDYTHPAGPDHRATVAVDYTINPGDSGTSVSMDQGASKMVMVSAEVVDLTQGGEKTFIAIERQMFAYVRVPLMDGPYKFQETPVLFKGGHKYQIFVRLMARADCFSGAGMDVNAWHGPSGESGGSSSVSTGITVNSIMLKTLEPPWVQTMIHAMYTPVSDTYDPYERALMAAVGRGYCISGAILRVSAGGMYDPALSYIRISAPNSTIVQLKDLPLQNTISQDGQTAQITLPPYDNLPLHGGTWNFVLRMDPEFLTPADRLDVQVPLFKPWIGLMQDMSLAIREELWAQKNAGVGKGPVLASLATPSGAHGSADPASLQAAATATVAVPAEDFYRARYWCLALPVAQFESLTLAEPTVVMPKLAIPMPVTLYVPSGVSTPVLNPAGLQVTTTPMPAFARSGGWQFSTEPVVVVRVLDLWAQFLRCSHPFAQRQGVEWCANPRFIRLLQQVGEREEAHRQHLDGLYWLKEPGVAIKLTDLPGSLIEAKLNRGPMVVSIGGAVIPVAVFLSPRLRKWVKRVILLSTLSQLWQEMRPRQSRHLGLNGYVEMVGNPSIYKEDSDGIDYEVLFDFIPELQPITGAEPTLYA